MTLYEMEQMGIDTLPSEEVAGMEAEYAKHHGH